MRTSFYYLGMGSDEIGSELYCAKPDSAQLEFQYFLLKVLALNVFVINLQVASQNMMTGSFCCTGACVKICRSGIACEAAGRHRLNGRWWEYDGSIHWFSKLITKCDWYCHTKHIFSF